jgi:uncharacterized Zn finger protein
MPEERRKQEVCRDCSHPQVYYEIVLNDLVKHCTNCNIVFPAQRKVDIEKFRELKGEFNG